MNAHKCQRDFKLPGLTSSSTSPLSPSLLVSSSAPGSLSPAFRPQFSDGNKKGFTDHGGTTEPRLQDAFSCPFARNPPRATKYKRDMRCTYLQLVQFLSDLDEAQMKLPTKMVSQTTVVVMETKVSGAHLAHTQLLLLKAGGGHGVPVLLLRRRMKKDEMGDMEVTHPQLEAPPKHFLLTSASFFFVRTFSTSCRTFWASSTLPSAPSCSALARSFPISSFSS